MNVIPVSNQSFDGRIIGCLRLTPEQRKIFRQVRPCWENLVKNKDYDLKLYMSYGRELRITTGKIPEYEVINSNNPDMWINRAKEIVKSYKKIMAKNECQHAG